MFDRLEFPFACPKCRRVERIVISRLDGVTQWVCEHCGQRTDLTEEPYAPKIAQLRRDASEIDKRRRQEGMTVERVNAASQDAAATSASAAPEHCVDDPA
jgi:transcription elongation factor Elf1